VRDERKRETLNAERGIKDSGSSIHHSSFRVHHFISSFIPSLLFAFAPRLPVPSGNSGLKSYGASSPLTVARAVAAFNRLP
jgi:hypothetical protein